MKQSTLVTCLYVVPLLFTIGIYLLYRFRRERGIEEIRSAEIEAGLTEPASLHPIIDYAKCLGCGTCVTACPEKHVLGIVGDKAELITPTHCIGHGACKAACPTDAITLVFGTEKRGLDIPLVKPNFETNVPGVFIAGELGGMGLIRNAITQGRQAMDSIRDLLKSKKSIPDGYDVVIIGAGPAGLAASLSAVEHKVKYLTIEQETMGGTVSHYPRGKVVMTQPAVLPIFGPTTFTETTKEKLLSFWTDIITKAGVKVSYLERVDAVTQENGMFLVKTSKGVHKTNAVLIAIGRRGTPRKLGVPGEDLEKVLYKLTDPDQYANKSVVVVGGGDSALEAAASIGEVEGTSVILSYRSESFGRAKQKNRDRIQAAETKGSLKVMLKSNIKNVTKEDITIEQNGQTETVKNDYIIVCAGGILPTGFLKDIGIQVETKHGTT